MSNLNFKPCANYMNIGEIALCKNQGMYSIQDYSLPEPFRVKVSGVHTFLFKYRDSLRESAFSGGTVNDGIIFEALQLNENYEYEVQIIDSEGNLYDSGAPYHYNGFRFKTTFRSAGL